MKETPALVLALLYWLHMLATVTWIGGLVTLAALVLPAARRELDAKSYSAFIGRVQERLQWVGWMSLLVLGGTGMFQMSANRNYNGFLAIDNPWSVAIFSKHIAILLMVGVSAYSTWGLMPALRRNAMLRAAGRQVSAGEEARLARQERLLLALNLGLSGLVLALTAWARAA